MKKTLFNRKLAVVFFAVIMMFTLFSNSVFATQTEGNFEGKVDIGGYSLYLKVQGERQKGIPTIVFESGYGGGAGEWTAIADELSQYTRVVTYDRANIGQSDAPLDHSFTSRDIAERLNTLLKKAKVNGPIILVGHSIAGLHMREFASMYPDLVKGIVFIDVSHEHMADYLFPEFPQEIKDMIMSADLEYAGYVEGDLAVLNNTYAQIDASRQLDALRNIPITVLSGGNHGYPPVFPDNRLEERWSAMQADVASLSDDSIHITDPNSGHFLHHQNPQLVIDSVLDLFDRIKN